MNPDPQQVVFLNGPVFMDGQAVQGVTVTVRGSRIAAVGRGHPEDRGHELIIDLRGRLLVPGFQDAHVHPGHGGLRRLRCDLTDLVDRDEALARIRAAAAGSEDWVLGGGWAFSWFERGCPSADLLDDLVGSKPAYLVVRDGHSAWANHEALRRAGVDASTPDPSDGRIERLPDGSPQGTLHEGAMELVQRIVPPVSARDLQTAILEGQRVLLSHGITAWQDGWVTEREHAAYRALAADGRLVASVRGAYWWDRGRGLEQIDEILQVMEEGVEPYRPGAVKLMLDGVCENFTASMIDPYVGAHGEGEDHRGLDFIDPSELRVIVAELHSAGVQCHFHAIGDGAVRSALDAVGYALSRRPGIGLRHHIAHLQVVHPDDVGRFSELGVVANCQALWACNEPAMTELTIPFLGPQRSGWQYPFGSIAAAGGTLAMGSDWPVSSPNVMAQIHVAVTRTPHDHEAPPLSPRHRLSLSEAFTAFTAGSASVNHLDPSRGAVAVGSVADLVVLDSNPFDRVGELPDVGVDLAMIGGRVVFDDGSGVT